MRVTLNSSFYLLLNNYSYSKKRLGMSKKSCFLTLFTLNLIKQLELEIFLIVKE
jgi:hypothetical protein